MDWSVYLVNNCPSIEKTKFLIVFKFSDEIRGFLINSKHHKLLKKSHNKVCVALIPSSSNPYLDHDSFVDCTKMISLEIHHLYNKKGTVCETAKCNIMSAILACPVLEHKIKKHLIQEHKTYLPS